MTERERFDRRVSKYQPDHRSFFERPHFSRRCFFRHAAAGVGGFLLADELARGETESAGTVETKNTAKNVIFPVPARCAEPRRHVRLQEPCERHADRLRPGNVRRHHLADGTPR